MSGALAALSGSGGVGGTVTVADKLAQSIVASPSLATASYALNTDGSVYINSVSNSVYCSPAGLTTLLECRMTVLAGSLSGSATGSWLALSSTRAWFIQQSGVGTNGASGTIEIREAGSGFTRGSATITFDAEVIA